MNTIKLTEYIDREIAESYEYLRDNPAIPEDVKTDAKRNVRALYNHLLDTSFNEEENAACEFGVIMALKQVKRFINRKENTFSDWVDAEVIESLVIDCLKEAQKETSAENKKKVWLGVLEYVGRNVEEWVYNNADYLELE